MRTTESGLSGGTVSTAASTATEGRGYAVRSGELETLISLLKQKCANVGTDGLARHRANPRTSKEVR
jgi:hypothetical protein